jgi:hypothetical protein
LQRRARPSACSDTGAADDDVVLISETIGSVSTYDVNFPKVKTTDKTIGPLRREV